MRLLFSLSSSFNLFILSNKARMSTIFSPNLFFKALIVSVAISLVPHLIGLSSLAIATLAKTSSKVAWWALLFFAHYCTYGSMNVEEYKPHQSW